MAIEIVMPRVDMDMTSGRMGRWHAAEGAHVDKGQTLFEIETDKAAMEVDAPASGVLKFVAASEGDVLPVGTCIGWIVAEGESFAPPVANAPPLPERDKLAPLAALALIPRRGRRGRRRSAPTPQRASRRTPVSRRAMGRGRGTRSASAPARRPPPGAWRASADCGSRA